MLRQLDGGDGQHGEAERGDQETSNQRVLNSSQAGPRFRLVDVKDRVNQAGRVAFGITRRRGTATIVSLSSGPINQKAPARKTMVAMV